MYPINAAAADTEYGQFFAGPVLLLSAHRQPVRQLGLPIM